MGKLYKIKDWHSHYENNRTRDMKKMSWVPLPIKLDGDGYTAIMEHKDGPAIFGAFIAVIEVAAKCEPRGTLIRTAGIPHDPASLSRLTRIDIKIIDRMLTVCTNECKWVEINESQEGAEIPQEGAEIPHKPVALGHSRTGNTRTEHSRRGDSAHAFEKSPFYEYQEFRKALKDWPDEKCEYFYEAAKGGSEAKGYTYKNWIAAVKNWDRKYPGEWERRPRRGFGPQPVSKERLKENAMKAMEMMEGQNG